MTINIFFLDHCPRQCAMWMVDKHVVKMVLETCQLLSSAHHMLGSGADGMCRLAFKNHPSAIWTRESKANYEWLLQHLHALLDEYSYRYNRSHACVRYLPHLNVIPPNIPSMGFTTPPSCMPKQYKQGTQDTRIHYQRYYNGNKAYMYASNNGTHTWTKRKPPPWATL